MSTTVHTHKLVHKVRSMTSHTQEVHRTGMQLLCDTITYGQLVMQDQANATSLQAGLQTCFGPASIMYFGHNSRKQESPAVADKPAQCESMPKIAPIRRAYSVVADSTGLTSLVYMLLLLKSVKSSKIL